MLMHALPAQATEFVQTEGRLNDDDFYRLVACGAAPDRPCTKPELRWQTRSPLRVALTRIDRAFLGGKQMRARAALIRALQYLNDAGAGFRLVQTDEPEIADIRIYLLDTDGSAPIENSGIEGIDGATIRGATVRIWWDTETRHITRATIVFSTNLPIAQYESAMLEEVTQALGFMTDIRNSAYDGLSIFSEDRNASKQLGPQDIMVLRRHYPPRGRP
ncbi:DUF2927 domain-containing protein [Lutimaribacter sp. EGI FJ00014]|uniref:DUF2927 domain-containing protein n=1 Tax=Lutimaribacter degradans TaxID=2945989 RepID=A0ACC5ZRI7_9RHOB|nr:DUF2927 domain-containing protein [Lutimaribacter sp. EGI FJ00013]MCM2560641.1 DUF2927 domain-containing protein [Lutimaribacter sp. EGI FJ00013]MCO0634465.1 DUF2927 domain-containing protein [Lutimaribacter sp. EGI FJ00014]